MEKSQIESLLEKFIAGKISPTESELWKDLLSSEADREQLESVLYEQMQSHDADGAYQSLEWQTVKQTILESDRIKEMSYDSPQRKFSGLRHLTKTWVRYAAAIILVAGAGGLFYKYQHSAPLRAVARATNPIIPDPVPGTDKAVLILGDGTTVNLDKQSDGKLAEQGNMQIVKLNSGEIAYRAQAGTETEMLMNTMRTPKGGQFQIVLPDGSKVWLNAASSLRYPSVFTGNDRTVELIGEGYFEVAKINGKPFHVKVNNVDVMVLGTHFNINGYEDETSIKTTLLEGAVSLSSGDEQLKLTPGQQANISAEAMHLVHDPDLEEVMAWKRGYFVFNNAPIDVIMRQIGRWYDMDIIYDKNISSKRLTGKASRQTQLSSLLKVLELNGIHFTIEGKNIRIKP